MTLTDIERRLDALEHEQQRTRRWTQTLERLFAEAVEELARLAQDADDAVLLGQIVDPEAPTQEYRP
jgi:hypothetical protein